MKQVTVTELRNRLSHYVRLVRKGETVVVLEHAIPVAELHGLSIGGEGEGDLRRLVRDGLVTAARTRASTGWLKEPPVQSSGDPVRALIDSR